MTKSAMERATERITDGSPVTILRRPAGQGPTARLAVRRSLVRMDMLHLGAPVDDDVVNAIVRAIQIQRGDWNPADHPRNPAGSVGGGKFRSLTARISDALKTHKKDGGGDPLKDFDREQLRKTAVKLGLKLRRGASEAEIKKMLLDHADAGHMPDAPKPKAKAAKKAAASAVVGRDLTGKGDLPLAEVAAAVGRSSDFGEDLGLAKISERQGFDGHPRVVSASELDAEIAGGSIELWRGVGRSGNKSADEVAESFRTGPLWNGRGRAGNGTTTTTSRALGELYADEGDSGLMRMALPKDARLVTSDELDAIIKRESPNWTADERLVYSDHGRLATALGYDAIKVSGDRGLSPTAKKISDGSDQYIVLNRTAVSVQRGGAAAPTKAPAGKKAAAAKKVAAPSAPTLQPAVKKAAPVKKATPLSALGADFKPIPLPSKEARDREILGDKEYERRQAAKKAAPAKRVPVKAAPAKTAPPKQPTPSVDAPKAADGYTGPRYEPAPGVDARVAADLRERLRPARPESWSRGYATRQIDSEYQSAEVKKLIDEVGVPAARRIALEADAETALARLVEFQRPPDPTLGPYDDLPPVTAAEMDHIKTEATRQLRQDFAGKKVGVRVTAGSLEQILANGRFKTQFETRRSGGGYVPTKRKTAEESMFGLPADTDPKVRPIYGYLAMEGVQPTPDGDLLNTYGDVQVILRQSVRQRTTASIGDSLDWEVLPSPVDDPSWESFNGAAHSSGGMQLDYAGRRSGLYVEAQIHDGVGVGDIEEIVFPAKPSSAMVAMLADRGISWRVLEP